VVLEVSPELLTFTTQFVLSDTNSAKAEVGKVCQEGWFGEQLPLFIEDANFLGFK
jgi:hypothetical protein